MKEEIAKRWVDALRSGKYTQTRGKLNNNNTGGFCCLGVLCDISGLDKWTPYIDDAGKPVDHRSLYLERDGVLPEPVRTWSGIHSSLGSFIEGDSLASRNDNGATFEEIADLIETRWKDL